jgi:hypothetical protein
VETRPRVRWPFLLALAVAVVALGVRYAFLTGGAGAGLRSLVKLGHPPQARALYDAWLVNFRRRVLVERHALIL